MARVWGYVISFPGNTPPHPLHTKAVVSMPASWLFVEKAFLGMPAWFGLVPKVS